MDTNKTFCEMLREKRRERMLTLREFCRQADEDPGNFSRIERGLRVPPADDALERYAKVLGLEGDDYRDFLDLGAIFRRELPRDIPDEALAGKLPAMLRSIERTRPTEQQLDNAIAITRRAFQK